MPTNAELALILRFRDQASQAVKQAAQGIAQSIEGIGQSVKSAGRQMRQLGREMLQLGAIVTGAFTIAIRDATATIPAVRDAVRSMGAEFSRFNQDIAQAVVPILNDLANAIHAIRLAFKSLDPAQRDFIVRVIFVGGMLTLVAGTVLRFAGTFLMAAGNIIQFVGALLLAHPVIATIAILVITVISVMGGWEKAFLAAARATDVIIESGQVFANLMASGLLRAIAAVARGLEELYNILGKLPGQWGANYREAAKAVHGFREEIDRMAIGAEQAVTQHWNTAANRFKEGGGVVEETVKNASSGIKAFIDALKNSRPALQAWNTALIEDLKKFWASYTDLKQRVSETLTGAVNNLESRFTTIFQKIITEGGKAKDAFKEFGRAILETVAGMIAKFLAFIATVAVVAAVLAAFGVPPSATFRAAFKFVGGFHQGGYVPGIPMKSYHSGGEVMANLEQGEFVVNKEATRKNRGLLEQMNNGTAAGSGGMQVVNIWQINATDAQSFRNQMAQNADLVEAMFQKAVKRNSGAMRQATRV